MAKVLGLGGVFFKCRDPEKLSAWYKQWLGIPAEYPNGAMLMAADMPDGGMTVWSPFAADTKYFAPSAQDFMINFVVDDLDGALRQVVQGGATPVGAVEKHDYGSFGWFLDPEGNKVELWQPPAV